MSAPDPIQRCAESLMESFLKPTFVPTYLLVLEELLMTVTSTADLMSVLTRYQIQISFLKINF